LNVQEVIAALRPAMTDPAIPKAAHNAGYDWVMLKRAGLEVAPVTEDTMLAEFVLNPDSSQGNLGLKRAAWRRLKLNMRNIDEIIGSGKGQISMAQVDLPQAAAYASADAVATYRLVGALGQAFRADPNPQARALYENLEMPLIRVLSEMEMAGILVDLPYLRELGADLEARMAAMAEEVYALAGEKFSLNSTKQLNVILFEKLGLSGAGLKKTQSQGFSLTASVLEDLAERENHPILQPLMAYRSLVKLHNTYVEALPELIHPVTGRVHTSFNQTGAITGRISSNNPNLQNIPIRTEEGRRVRGAFIAAPGHLLLSVDYSQIELRILAHFSGDETLRAAFQQGEDVHRSTAAKIHHIPLEAVTYEQRRFAKAVNFGLMYGMGAYRLTRDSDLTLGESQKFIEQYFATFPTVKDYLETTKAFAKQEGYVQTLFGRRRYFPDLQTEGLGHNARNRAEREAINAPIQGTAADIMKKAMILLDGRLQRAGLRAKLLLQVHDELVLEAPEDEVDSLKALVTEAMLEAGSILSVPVGVEARAGANWAEMG
jgi:DNA polymerase-1